MIIKGQPPSLLRSPTPIFLVELIFRFLGTNFFRRSQFFMRNHIFRQSHIFRSSHFLGGVIIYSEKIKCSVCHLRQSNVNEIQCVRWSPKSYTFSDSLVKSD